MKRRKYNFNGCAGYFAEHDGGYVVGRITKGSMTEVRFDNVREAAVAFSGALEADMHRAILFEAAAEGIDISIKRSDKGA